MRAPAVIRFEGTLVKSPANGKASKLYVDVPRSAAVKLRGMETIEGVINGHPFRAPFDEAGLLRVNDAMLRGANARCGDVVRLAVLGPEPEPTIPPDLQRAFAQVPEAKALWSELTHLARLDWIRWIDGTKNTQTRERRITRTVEQLAEGKRRPCCVNFYDYMLRRVEASEISD
jgi:hypothetical protein